MNNAEEWISDIRENNGNHLIKTSDWKTNEKTQSNIRHLWDNIKWTNLCIIGIPDREEKEKGIETIFEEIMSENFPNIKETVIKHWGPQISWTQIGPH